MKRKGATRAWSLLLAVALLWAAAGGSLASADGAGAGAPFVDVAGHWAQERIGSWVERDLARGYPDGTFGPDHQVTRTEFVAFMNRAYDGPSSSADPGFEDVQEGDWYYQHVADAVEAGLVSGYPDGTFGPGDAITREEAAAIVNRLLDLEDAGVPEPFADQDQVSEWARKAVEAVGAAGIVAGYPDGTFRPGAPVTRAEAVSILDRGLDALSPPGRAVLTSREGPVTVQSGDGVDPAPATTGMELAPHYRLMTGEGGEAELLLEDNSRVRLAPQSQVTLEALYHRGSDGEETTVLRLDRGSAWSSVEPTGGADSRFEFHTPAAVVRALGTQFLVQVDDEGDTLVRVYSGSVGVAPPPSTDPVRAATGTGGETLLGPFQQTRSTPDVPPPPDHDPVDPLDVGEFEKDNLVEDQPEAYAEVGYQASELLAEQAEERLKEEAAVLARLQRELALLQEKVGAETDPDRLESLLALQENLNQELDLTMEMIDDILKDREEHLQNQELFSELGEQAEVLDPDQLRERARELREKEREADAQRQARQEASEEREAYRDEAREQAKQGAEDLGLGDDLQSAVERVTDDDIDEIFDGILTDPKEVYENIKSGADNGTEDDDEDPPSGTTRSRVRLDVDDIVLTEEEALEIGEIEVDGIVGHFDELSSNATSFSARSDNSEVVEVEDGRFIITGDPGEAEITLTGSRSGYRSRARTFLVTVGYKVTFEENNGLDNVDIEVFEDEGHEKQVRDPVETDGGKAEKVLPDGHYWFVAQKDDYEDCEGQFEVDGEGKTVKFALGPLTGNIEGTVKLAKDISEIKQIEQIEVKVSAGGEASDTVTLTDPNREGDYVLEDLSYGEYQVSAEVVEVTPLVKNGELDEEDFWVVSEDGETVEVDGENVSGPDYQVRRALLVSLVELEDKEGVVEGAFDNETKLLQDKTDSFRVLRGTDVTFTALPYVGWEFAFWTEDAKAETEQEFTVTIDMDYDIGVSFMAVN